MENSDKIDYSAGDVFEETITNIVLLSPSRQSSSSSSSGSYRRTMSSSDKLNSTSIYCRICHEDESSEELVDPCKCAGSLGLIHASCLEKWLSTSNTDRCEICKYIFIIQRKNKPISQWWQSASSNGPRGVAGDFICLMILTPLCIVATYLCALGASAYSRLGYWEGIGLAVLGSLLLATYCLWLGITIRFHYKTWRRWRKQNQDVTLLVKHKTDASEILNEKSPPKREIQDRNNNRNMDGYNRYHNRFIFNVAFGHEEDPVYTFRQQTSFV